MATRPHSEHPGAAEAPGATAGTASPLVVPGIRYAGWPRRAVALVIDGVVVWLAFALLAELLDDAFAPAPVALWLVFPLYFTLAHGSRRGRTLGKAAVGATVRSATTLGPLGYGRALARWLVAFVLWVPFFLGTSIAFLVVLGFEAEGAAQLAALVVVWLLSAAPGVLDALSPLWNARRRAWHDRAAGSVVVRL